MWKYVAAFFKGIAKWLIAVAFFWLIALLIVGLAKYLPQIFPSIDQQTLGVYVGNGLIIVLIAIFIVYQVKRRKRKQP